MSSSSSVSTAALSSLLTSQNNGSSGLDVAAAVNSIIAAERAPEVAWQNQQAKLNNQASAIHQIESEISSVTDQLHNLSDFTGAFSTVSATSTNASVVTASAISGTTSGTHTITVSNLASSGSAYSAQQTSSSATLAGDSFSITQGSNTVTFTIGSGNSNTTLDQLSASINSAGLSVNASIVNDANGARLALVAKNSGTAADFSISGGATLGLTHTAGVDASLQVDGIPITSASNTVTGAITGVTFSLQAPSANPVTITLAPDSSTIQSTLSSFVNSYNTLIKDLNAQFTYNGATSSEGVLAADSAARSLQSDVLGASNLTIGFGSIQTLASLGITTNQDGTLTLDSSKLSQAISTNYSGVVGFFQGSNGTAGFASTLIGTLGGYTDPSQGSFTVDLKSNSNEFNDLQDQINRYEIYIATQQTLLTTEYNNANIALQQLPQKIKQTNALLGNNSNSGNN